MLDRSTAADSLLGGEKYENVHFRMSMQFIAMLFPLVIVAYAVYAILSGRIDGVRRAAPVYRDEQPVSFWIIIVMLFGFAGFLFFVFGHK